MEQPFFLEESLFRLKDRLMTRVRSVYWRHRIPDHQSNFTVYGKIWVRFPKNILIGHRVKLSEGVYINARDQVRIGNDVQLSAYVRINTGALSINLPPEQRGKHVSAPVRIGDHVWLATGVIVNPGVTIHEGVIVGAGSVVARDLPPYTLCVGAPAKPIRDLPRPEKI